MSIFNHKLLFMKYFLIAILLIPSKPEAVVLADGKPGTIININCSPSKNNTPPLCTINGLIIPDTLLKKINPDNISSINVFKNLAAREKYGDKAKNGVIEIILKEDAFNKMRQQGFFIPIL